ncbi:hypothetical protein [Sphingomonas sp. 1P08PE]|uniref:hypothetical protein n=1 Tax=Sphingomonas sp. 1P08PE TaxID=554122 RepID=UPI0039A1E1F4
MSNLFLVFTLLTAPADIAKRGSPIESWSRPGVGYAEYRSDSVDCAKAGFFRDVSKDEPAKKFIRGFITADDELNKGDIGGPSPDRWMEAISRTQPDRLKRDVHAIQVGDVEQCLLGKGYRKFALSREERSELGRLRPGSEARHRFMHDLSSRPR